MPRRGCEEGGSCPSLNKDSFLYVQRKVAKESLCSAIYHKLSVASILTSSSLRCGLQLKDRKIEGIGVRHTSTVREEFRGFLRVILLYIYSVNTPPT